MHQAAYHFRPLEQADLPLVETWLKTPAVRHWWGDPDEELALIMGDMNDPRMSMRVVSFNDKPFAYTQDYEVHAWPQAHLSHLASGTRAIDTMIGVPSMLGKGHGPIYLRQLAEMLLTEGASSVVIDPEADNHAARRAYEKAGFSVIDEITTDQGVAVLMHFDG